MLLRELRCQSCGAPFTAKRSDAKWCEDCKVIAYRQTQQLSEERRRHSCPECGTTISRSSMRCRGCGQKSRIAKLSGDQNYAWKGGRSESKGYIYLLVAPEARKGHRYRAEHQLVWEAANGSIPEGYVIHHINGVKDDNRLENLEAMPRKKHNHRHDEHDKRILELEAEVARLREQLNGDLHP